MDLATLDDSPAGTGEERTLTTADYLSVADFTAEQKGTQGFLLRALHRPQPRPRVKRAQSLLDSHAVEPGFMFWSVTINPVEESLIVWNTGAHSVQCRHLANLTLKWEIKGIRQADCLTIAADKGHVYMTDYSHDGPTANEHWFGAISRSSYKTLDKYFIVVDSATGRVLANRTISEAAGVQQSVVVSGANGDVFVGTGPALVRIHT